MSSNPFSGIITSELKTLFTNMIDAMLEDAACMVLCQLIYGDTKFTVCPNCIIDVNSKRSTGIYKSGGLKPFSIGNCPVCYGQGRFAVESTDSIYLLPLWDYHQWVGWKGVEARTLMLQGYIQTMSKIDTYDQLKRAKEVIIDTTLNVSKHHRFEREGEPNPMGLGASSYIITMWKAIQ